MPAYTPLIKRLELAGFIILEKSMIWNVVFLMKIYVKLLLTALNAEFWI